MMNGFKYLIATCKIAFVRFRSVLEYYEVINMLSMMSFDKNQIAAMKCSFIKVLYGY